MGNADYYDYEFLTWLAIMVIKYHYTIPQIKFLDERYLKQEIGLNGSIALLL
jgi:hypothetical protein